MHSLFIFLTLFAVSAALPHQDGRSPDAALLVAEVQVRGATLVTGDDVAKLSGLAVGKRTAISELRSAAERLAASGLFTSVAFRYVTASGRTVVTFDVVEAERTLPVTFDNFVWFSAQEVMAAVRADVPAFDGKAPHTEGAPDLIARSLQGLLSARQLPGRVAFLPQATPTGELLGYLFRVEDPSPRICAVSLAGASPIARKELERAAAALSGKDYSHAYVSAMMAGTLIDIYRRLGYWRAAFEPPSVSVDAPGCSGVSLTLAAKEGPSYTWAKADWSGHAAATAETLDTLLGMKAGEVADAAKIGAGELSISKAYGRQGFILARTSTTPRLDDATRTAVFEIRVDEGPRFQMGTVEVKGFPENEAAALIKRWKLAEGQVYDAGYPSEFHMKELAPLQRAGRRSSVQIQVDRQNHRVNVLIAAAQ